MKYLILTCNSQTSRNFTLGVKLGRGMNINEATNGLTSIAEGMFSTKAIVKLAKIHNVIMPITDSINKKHRTIRNSKFLTSSTRKVTALW